MKKIRLLLGNSEGLLNDLIEVLTQDMCGGYAVVECTRAARLGEFVELASTGQFDLAIMIPNNLRSAPDQPPAECWGAEAARGVRTIKSQSTTPVIAVAMFAQYEFLLAEAGADFVLDMPFKGDELRSAVRQLLRVPRADIRRSTDRGLFSWVSSLFSQSSPALEVRDRERSAVVRA